MNLIELECEELLNKIDFSKLSNKKVLITGASGLIGVYITSCLKQVSKLYNIEIYSWFRNDLPPEFSSIFNGCNIIKSDITDYSNIERLPMFDCIIHSAGYGQPNRFLEDKIKTIKLNTSSTIELFKKLNKGGKFMFISSSEVYSGITSDNISETEIGTTNTSHPRSCYIEGKRCGESICYSYLNDGFDVKIIRLSLTYGPGTKKNDQRVLNSLIQKGLTDDTIKLVDNGEAIRTFCYITDVTEMILNILLNGKDVIYNVGGISKLSILELSKKIAFILNKDVELGENNIGLVGNPKTVNISIEKYLNEFNKEFIPIDVGLSNTIKWQKELYEKE
jgi:nucleoside-diphosphate-sugar epimerase